MITISDIYTPHNASSNSASENDYLAQYEAAVQGLIAAPHDRALQHRAVLSLARAGALDFALAEYARYGLADVDDNEDIMALWGRLLKDRYQRNRAKLGSSDRAVVIAGQSSEAYARAYVATQGYYSGVNAATMALLGGKSFGYVKELATEVLKFLPLPEALSPTEHYFIEATRAECYLLLGQAKEAEDSLGAAIAFDPLNYTAHTATLKQFRMILSYKGEDDRRLARYSPPKPVYYAGHIWSLPDARVKSPSRMPDNVIANVETVLSDILQGHDIGFGYGSLAAGADIVIAEALLNEGAELHISLPCPVDIFLNTSVIPYGKAWEARFKACYDKARSVNIVSEFALWPDPHTNQWVGRMTMGQAMDRAKRLCVDPAQLLMWNEQSDGSYTAVHARDWDSTGYVRIGAFGNTPAENMADIESQPAPMDKVPVICQQSEAIALEHFDDYAKAVDMCLDALLETPKQKFALDLNEGGLEDGGTPEGQHVNAIFNTAIPQGLFVSEPLANLLAFSHPLALNVIFAGLIKDANKPTESGLSRRFFSVSR